MATSLKTNFWKGEILPIGYDKHTGIQFGNNIFIMNCIDYLLENNVFISVRSKT